MAQFESQQEALKAAGLDVMPTEEAVSKADMIIFAVPDAAIPGLSGALVPLMKPGAIAIILDPAAAYAKKVTLREDCTFVVVHPCHPPLFGDRDTQAEKDDLFGGTAAKQDIVIALLAGKEEDFAKAEALCRHMFNPVVNSHRITVQ